MDVDVDTEDFIAEIEQFPDIWDTSSNDYGNKVIKKNSWEQGHIKILPGLWSQTLCFGDKPTAEKTTIVLRSAAARVVSPGGKRKTMVSPLYFDTLNYILTGKDATLKQVTHFCRYVTRNVVVLTYFSSLFSFSPIELYTNWNGRKAYKRIDTVESGAREKDRLFGSISNFVLLMSNVVVSY
ncbi:hypothetical protein RI129_011157 [Pyrocoelia pectoralis]|uniref:Uncharacterized protein n=1 Tax=Pyrocoelia pectoralis TaxID=417401 RepID=A0AAN7V7I7_9COLE